MGLWGSRLADYFEYYFPEEQAHVTYFQGAWDGRPVGWFETSTEGERMEIYEHGIFLTQNRLIDKFFCFF